MLNCAEIETALLVITYTIAPVNLLSSPVHLTKTTFAKRHVPLEVNVTLGHAHFYGKLGLFVRPLGSPHTKPPTKFEVFSSSSFGVIDATMVDMTLIRPLNKGQDHSFWYQSISHV